MSLDYSLKMLSNIEPLKVLEAIKNAFPSLYWQDGRLCGEGFLIHAYQVDKMSADLAESDFGFRPSTGIYFRIASLGSRFDLEDIFDMILPLLHQESGNAFFLFNNEITLFQRLNDQLVFNETEWVPWMESKLIAAGMSYEIKQLHSPL